MNLKISIKRDKLSSNINYNPFKISCGDISISVFISKSFAKIKFKHCI